MYESEMSFIIHIIKIVKIIVDLDGSELAFVDDVPIAEGANVEPFGETDFVCTLFAKDVQLSLEMFFVKGCCRGRFVAGAVMLGKDDDRLEDSRFLGQSGWSEDGTVTWDIAPAENSQAERVGDLFKYRLRVGPFLVFPMEEYVADGILTGRREPEALVEFKFSLEEFVGDGCHHPCAIAITGIRTHGAPMGHVAQQTAGWRAQLVSSEEKEGDTIGDNLVADLAFDVTEERVSLQLRGEEKAGRCLPHKADAAGILFKLRIIEPLLDGDGSCPGGVLHWYTLLELRREDLINLVDHNQVGGPIEGGRSSSAGGKVSGRYGDGGGRRTGRL